MIFHNFESTDTVLGRTNTVSSGFWYDGSYELSQSFLSIDTNQTIETGSNSYDIKNGLYYYNVYNDDPSYSHSQVHFTITYGDYAGSGSSSTYETLKLFPTKAIYSQYKNYLLNPEDSLFSFRTGSLTVSSNTDNTTTVNSETIFVINFSGDKFKDRVDQGQLEFSLTGTNGTFSFIDDSSILGKKSDVYNIISGSINNGIPTTYTSGGYVPYKALGLFYPKLGIIILNAASINTLIGIPTYSRITTTKNHQYLYNVLVASTTKTMKVRKSEFIPSRHYFVRVKNQDSNYSNNPTFYSDGTDGKTKGTIKIDDFLTNPKTYITTIGLYDDSNELIAVAKLSQPCQKSFDNELNIRIRLDM